MINTAAFTDIMTFKERWALIRDLEFSPQPVRNGRTALFEESEMDLSLAGYPSVDVLLSAAITRQRGHLWSCRHV